MYSDNDISTGVDAGALTAEAAQAFRDHIANRRETTIPDDEGVKIVTGNNDYMVTTASLLLLIALGWLGWQSSALVAGLLIAGASWGLAELFVRRRDMGLPAILLAFTFPLGVGIFMTMASISSFPTASSISMIALFVAAACFLFRWRFAAPTAIANAAAALCVAVLAMFSSTIMSPTSFSWLLILCGIGVFAAAMWRDKADRHRLTKASEEGFWLHWVAAPLIVQPLVGLLATMGMKTPEYMSGTQSSGLINASYSAPVRIAPPPPPIYNAPPVYEPSPFGVSPYNPWGGLGMLTEAMSAFSMISMSILFVLLIAIALIVDRRALVQASIAFMIFVFAAMIGFVSHGGYAFAISAVIISLILLALSWFWSEARAILVNAMPDGIKDMVPPVKSSGPENWDSAETESDGPNPKSG